MEKKTILFASILKPADEVRMYEKLGGSISDLDNLDLAFFGSEKLGSFSSFGIFRDDFKYTRNPFKRIRRAIQFLFFSTKLNPNIIVICTWELLLPVLILKLFRSPKIIYDVQENYKANISQNRSLHSIAGSLVRTIEHHTRPIIHKYTLAEKCYQQELPFSKEKSTVLENKSLKTRKRQLEKENLLVYPGTIANQTGLSELLEWLGALKEIKVLVIGHCPSKRDLQRLEIAEKKYSNLSLNVSNQPLPYPLVQECIEKSKWIWAHYRNLESIKNRIPTRFFEGLASSSTVLASQNPNYLTFFNQYGGGTQISNENELKKVIHERSAFPIRAKEEDYLWIQEKESFNSLIRIILNSN